MAISYPNIKVRMYRQGLGDCFLLTIQASPRKKRYLLIDCGVFMGTPDGTDRMKAVVADIKETTGGKLDVVVATHEHYDHLSGFNQARDLFDEMEVSEVWLAWTEDPDNALARSLRKEQDARIAALDRSLAELALHFDEQYLSQFKGILEFFGPLGAAGRRSIRDAIAYLQEKPGRSNGVRYLRPGEAPLSIPEIDGVRCFVLGPPEKEEWLERSLPSSQSEEVYHEFQALGLAQPQDVMLARFGRSAKDSETADPDRDFPFSRNYKIADTDAVSRYNLFRRYRQEDDWRRIDHDWLRSMEELALQLDNDTNNTSLALAIELIDSGKVLLFPGDAQVGNWLSWDEVSWQLPAPGGTARTVTAADLLRRTVLYKVGHHGSHNATLKEQGLERMTSSELVAMIPVDQEMVEKRDWAMPFEPLFRRLYQKTSGRVIRADLGVAPPPEGIKAPSTSSQKMKTFKRRLTEKKLYLEYLVS